MNAGGVDKACKSNAEHHFASKITKSFFYICGRIDKPIWFLGDKVVLGVANEVVTRRNLPRSLA